MTNEQAINWLVAIKEKYIHGGDEGFDELRKEALDKAVKALEEERPRGEWIYDSDHSITIDMYKCSVCGCYGHTHFKFCPNCGADMRGEK